MSSALLKELAEQAKVSTSTAASVYHRDYERTKNKPYRKYDATKHAEENEEASNLDNEEVCVYYKKPGSDQHEVIAGPFTRAQAIAWCKDHNDEITDTSELFIESVVGEGMWTFTKGALGHVAGSVKQGISNTIDAGRQSSLMGNISKLIKDIAKNLSIKQQMETGRSEQPQPKQEPTMSTRPDGTPAAFKTDDSAKFVAGSHGPEYQFSAYLIQTDAQFMTEGVIDFIKGMGSHVGHSISQGINNTIQAGHQSELDNANTSITNDVQELILLLQKLGPSASKQLPELVSANVSDPNQRAQIVNIITSSAKQWNVRI